MSPSLISALVRLFCFVHVPYGAGSRVCFICDTWTVFPFLDRFALLSVFLIQSPAREPTTWRRPPESALRPVWSNWIVKKRNRSVRRWRFGREFYRKNWQSMTGTSNRCSNLNRTQFKPCFGSRWRRWESCSAASRNSCSRQWMLYYRYPYWSCSMMLKVDQGY